MVLPAGAAGVAERLAEQHEVRGGVAGTGVPGGVGEEVDPGVVEVRVAVLRLDLAVWQARGVTHPSQGGGPPTMSASHSKELPGTVSELVGRRFRIVPAVGLVDRDVLLT